MSSFHPFAKRIFRQSGSWQIEITENLCYYGGEMSAPSPEIEQAARAAAARVKDMIVAMLMANELGEVAVIVGFSSLEPEKRIREKAKIVKVARGRLLTMRE